MVDSINTSSVPSVPSPHAATKSDAGDYGKTGDVKGEKLNNGATLSASKADPAESYEPGEGTATAQNDKRVQQVSRSVQNEPPGSRIDVLV